ncbi:AI-2E family transporter [uncultured Cohaesibacter sp.]|uniref:AI-2E family transporter n=1 Tax=uncultured Cohaesibacter sp. TaxID=1002546 RepID=UPI0029C66A1B|nr:AI-2E family transporter [uncultured Cohaesibacter sp.]
MTSTPLKDPRVQPASGLFNPGDDAHLRRGAHAAMILMGLVTLFVALYYSQAVLAPLTLSVIIGLMLGPLVDRIEAFGVPPWVSATVAICLFILFIGTLIAGFAVPLSDWMDRLPYVWSGLQTELTNWKGLLSSLSNLQDQFNEIAGSDPRSLTVNVNEGDPVAQVAYLAPSLVTKIILFLAGLFFFIATRHQIKYTLMSKMDGSRRRRRLSIMFKDIEKIISSYMLHITAINIGLAVCVTVGLWLVGVPSPMLWGMLAGILNFVIYIGPAIMTCILLALGLAISSQLSSFIVPAAVYLGMNLIEAQFVTPMALGRVMTINPFLVFLSIVFWIWLWGPIGGFVAVPLLLMLQLVLQHIDLMASDKPISSSEG